MRSLLLCLAFLSSPVLARDATHIPTVAIRRGVASRLVGFTAFTAYDVDTLEVIPAPAGRAAQLLVKVGDPVTAGQKLAELDHGRVVRAPGAGTVVAIAVQEGQLLEAGSPMFKLAATDRLWADVLLPARDAAGVLPGTPVHGHTTAGVDLVARVARVTLRSDPQSTVSDVRLEIENGDHLLRNGESIEGTVLIRSNLHLLAVPVGAVFLDRGASFVFVRTPEGRFERRTVLTGSITDGWREIVAGLSGDEQVAVIASRVMGSVAERPPGR